MARRRGLGNAERVALDMATITATGAVVSAPCFVYSLQASLTSTLATGLFAIGDTTAAADLVKETSRLQYTVNASGTAPGEVARIFFPPLYIANQLFWTNSTGIASVSVSYLAAS